MHTDHCYGVSLQELQLLRSASILWYWCCSVDSRGHAWAYSRPAKPQWLPASVPAGVGSCLHDDREAALFSGAWHSEWSWKRMHGSHTADARPSVGYAYSLRYSLQACQPAWLMIRIPPDLFWLPRFCILSLQLPSLWQPDSPVTGSYFLEPSFKYMLLFVCDWMPLSLSRSWTWINHKDTRLLCSYNKAVTSPYHTPILFHTHTRFKIVHTGLKVRDSVIIAYQ